MVSITPWGGGGDEFRLLAPDRYRGDETLRKLEPLIQEAAARHNRLEGVSNQEFAEWMNGVLVVERGGPLADNPFYGLGANIWQGAKMVHNYLGGNSSVGIAQIRPETAVQLMRGYIAHEGKVLYHGVQVAYPVWGRGSYGVSPEKLGKPEVSIEYLAANMEMGTVVARSFGYEPTLEDLVRWHNTGIGSWNLPLPGSEGRLWTKGSQYVRKLKGWSGGLPSSSLARAFKGGRGYIFDEE